MDQFRLVPMQIPSRKQVLRPKGLQKFSFNISRLCCTMHKLTIKLKKAACGSKPAPAAVLLNRIRTKISAKCERGFFKPAGRKKSSGYRCTSWKKCMNIPEGSLPVYVGKGGKDLTRFVIDAHLLNHPNFGELLQICFEEYGYEQKGGLQIPCEVIFFQRILTSLNANSDDPLFPLLEV